MERWKRKWRSCREDLIKRRLGGIGLMAATIPVVKMMEGDATIALLTIPSAFQKTYTAPMVLSAKLSFHLLPSSSLQVL